VSSEVLEFEKAIILPAREGKRWIGKFNAGGKEVVNYL
jgi:hypothetical protein